MISSITMTMALNYKDNGGTDADSTMVLIFVVLRLFLSHSDRLFTSFTKLSFLIF